MSIVSREPSTVSRAIVFDYRNDRRDRRYIYAYRYYRDIARTIIRERNAASATLRQVRRPTDPIHEGAVPGGGTRDVLRCVRALVAVGSLDFIHLPDNRRVPVCSSGTCRRASARAQGPPVAVPRARRCRSPASAATSVIVFLPRPAPRRPALPFRERNVGASAGRVAPSRHDDAKFSHWGATSRKFYERR